jgi:hypothetical protein
MVALPDVDRAAIWQAVMSDLSELREPLGLNKTDLRAAVNAIDVWVDSNAASLNTAIPQPARGALSQTQKTRLFLAVVSRRFLGGM